MSDPIPMRILIPVIFILSFVAELLLEHFGKVDSIGLWYTILVAFVYSLIALAAVYWMNKLWKSRR
jgi:predicted membrane metal-binding protein